jgi:hypothetical protein
MKEIWMRVKGHATPIVLAWLVCFAGPVFAQSFPAGMARHAKGVLVVVRADGVESHLQGRGALQIFEGDTLRVDGEGQALIETEEGVQVALNRSTVVKVLTRWEKSKGTTRILRLQRGEVWARSLKSQALLEIETPVGVLSANAAEVSVNLVSDNEAVATVVQGTANLSTSTSSCPLRAGTMSRGSRGNACSAAAGAQVSSATAWSYPLLVP